MIDQEAEAQRFITNFQNDIGNAEKVVGEAVERFLGGSAKSILDEKTQQKLRDLVARKDYQVASRQLREHATEFSGNSAHFWSVIDAMNFLADATGTNWPYMTANRRQQYLAFAVEEAQAIP